MTVTMVSLDRSSRQQVYPRNRKGVPVNLGKPLPVRLLFVLTMSPPACDWAVEEKSADC